ncbi:MAG: valine--tRNA ligase [Actinomycetota bacterium]|nr:valine--tRNA ligase [Actinomycetota bacterium]
MATIPEKPTLDGIEARWASRWEADGTYRFDREVARRSERTAVFSIDTPPPTVSGSIHMGTVFGYTQTDAIARYQRMAGKEVFFPIGWDDNGLATERRVQNFYGVRCDPTQPYTPGYEPPFRGGVPKQHQDVPISRANFIELCQELTAIDEAVFEDVFRRLGMSYDWSLLYTTINDVSRRTSQVAFLHNLARGEAYSAEAPTLWDVDFRTAVAQAEMEDRERPGAYHLLAFHGPDGDVLVDTTRPELLVSCVAVVCHPDDARHAGLVGSSVRTPIFGVEVPVVVHPLAEPDKGTGIAMVCTFGDTTDVTWWRELDLPTRSVIGRDGRLAAATPDWLTTGAARTAYDELAGRTVKQAQSATVELLRSTGELRGDVRPLTHPVKFYERGERPLEIVTSRQWYIRNGGRDQARRETFLRRGKELAWFPDHMRHRYEHWVEGLNGDWLISRQRFFGVPIPLWYPVDADGEVDYVQPLLPDEQRLPIDPSIDVPPGFTADQRGKPGGFVGDADIMDTWATSSLTPQIAAGWTDDRALFERLFPMDLRAQGPEIIRTWLFSTVVRAHYEHGTLPWSATTINGWILDPDRKKMSKSKGNVVTPMPLFERYGTDAVRYWAISARPGVDTVVSEDQMKVGRRLATKLLNVTKFVLGQVDATGADSPDHAAAGTATVTSPVDAAMLQRLDGVVADATRAFDGFDYARALERVESFFWWFCDDYVELVKGRSYGGRGDDAATSARLALTTALDALQRLLAPTLPFAAEEAWSWWHDSSVHLASWPRPGAAGDRDSSSGATVPDALDTVSEVLARVRRAKTQAKLSQRAGVQRLVVTAPAGARVALEAAGDDLVDTLTIGELVITDGAEFDVDVELEAPPPA